jgi:hypothetical protein
MVVIGRTLALVEARNVSDCRMRSQREAYGVVLLARGRTHD